jgi:hypothetical protein
MIYFYVKDWLPCLSGIVYCIQLLVDTPAATNHSVACILFGLNGYLFCSLSLVCLFLIALDRYYKVVYSIVLSRSIMTAFTALAILFAIGIGIVVAGLPNLPIVLNRDYLCTMSPNNVYARILLINIVFVIGIVVLCK